MADLERLTKQNRDLLAKLEAANIVVPNVEVLRDLLAKSDEAVAVGKQASSSIDNEDADEEADDVMSKVQDNEDDNVDDDDDDDDDDVEDVEDDQYLSVYLRFVTKLPS